MYNLTSGLVSSKHYASQQKSYFPEINKSGIKTSRSRVSHLKIFVHIFQKFILTYTNTSTSSSAHYFKHVKLLSYNAWNGRPRKIFCVSGHSTYTSFNSYFTFWYIIFSCVKPQTSFFSQNWMKTYKLYPPQKGHHLQS